MARQSLHERLKRLEWRERSAPAPTAAIDEKTLSRYYSGLDALWARRHAVFAEREKLSLMHQLALARQDCAVADADPGMHGVFRWRMHLAARRLEIEILERDGLATGDQLAALRKDCARFLAPFRALPTVIDVASVSNDALLSVELDIAAWKAEHAGLRAAVARLRPDPDSYRGLRASLLEHSAPEKPSHG